jgi:hypothetical protein
MESSTGILILKPGKPPNELTSYWPIGLLPIVSKVCERLLLKRLLKMVENNGFIPNHQFGFRQAFHNRKSASSYKKKKMKL